MYTKELLQRQHTLAQEIRAMVALGESKGVAFRQAQSVKLGDKRRQLREVTLVINLLCQLREDSVIEDNDRETLRRMSARGTGARTIELEIKSGDSILGLIKTWSEAREAAGLKSEDAYNRVLKMIVDAGYEADMSSGLVK